MLTLSIDLDVTKFMMVSGFTSNSNSSVEFTINYVEFQNNITNTDAKIFFNYSKINLNIIC